MSHHESVPDLVVDCSCQLGEAPTWDAARQRLLWLDIEGQVLHQLDGRGLHTSTVLDRRTSVVVPDASDGLVAVVGLSVDRLDDSGSFETTIASLPEDGDGMANDGRCDPMGRLWVGTVDRSGAKRGGVFCVDDHGSVTTVRTDVALSNGIDWSPDGRTCYYVDSLLHRVDALRLDGDGLPVRTETLVEVEAIPDGLSVDADGGIWVALWDGGAVHRYTPEGELDRIVRVPHGFVTSCAFGGADSTTLFITTAWTGLSEAQRQQQPTAGALLALDAGVSGRGYTPFGRLETPDARDALPPAP